MMTKQEFFARGNEYFFFDDPKRVAEYCRKHWPEDCEHIIRVADEVCRNYFLFDLEHDMERTWEPVVFDPDGDVDWEYRPGNDPEFTFQFNRHRFFICLGQAYWLTGDEKYVRHFVRLLMSWIQNVKKTPETEKTTWRILEVGIRGEFWVKAIRYFKDSPLLTDEIVDAFYRCMTEHGEYIIQMHSPYRYMSNWGVIENHGLFEIGVMMPDPEKRERYTRIALEHLEVEARMQIMGDGVQWEQSPLYHNEVLHCFEDVLILASRNDIEVPDTILNAVHKMACADLMWKKPDHRQFLMGDSDDMDIRDYISVAAYLFKDPMLKYGGFPVLDFESVWDLGIESAECYERMKVQEPDFLSGALSDSGNYYLREKWGEDGNLLHFHCGTMGAGHGHSDKLHLDLVVGGEDVLTDAGRCTYVVDEGRFEFKDPTAHNTITVDGKFFTVCRDSWECSKLCQPVKEQFKFTDDYEYVQGGHLGYAEDGVFVNRKVVYIRPDIYIVMDELYSGGNHTYQQYWNFSERGKVELSGPEPVEVESDEALSGGAAAVAGFKGERAAARFFFMTPGISVEPYQGKIARHYNRYEMRQGICVSQSAGGFASYLTVIQAAADGKPEPVRVQKIPVNSALKGIQYPSSMAEAVKISCHDTEYVVIFCHQEVNSPTDLEEADGCMGYGNVIVFDKKKDVLVGTVLQY
ncbi:MAG: heparinase II/III family protein [Eubacteriales bacterium]|nr:heparinase II/III family protein [Eubacteriales bacterium]